MKAKLMLMILGLSMLLMTGCANSTQLTDDEEDMIAEYAAGLVLKYDKKYDQALIEPTEEQEEPEEVVPEITPTPSPTPTPAPTKNEITQESGSNDKPNTNLQANADFTEVIGIKGLTIEYSGYKTVKSYSDPYFTIESEDGKQLVVVNFKVTNTAAKDIVMNLANSEIAYQLDINTGTFGKPLLTFLDNDLRFIDTTVEAKKSKDTVLIFSISEKIDMNVVNVIISRNDKTAIVKLK